MTGLSSLRFSILIPSLLLAALPLLAQAPGQPGYPADTPGAAPAGAPDGQEEGPAGPGVARISLLDGDVSVRRGDSGDYVAAVANAPVMAQDSIQTGAGARSEVQFDSANMIRLAQNTEVHFTSLENGHFQMELGRGTVTYRMFRNVNAQVEINTPSISIRPSREGVYRVTVTDNGQTYVTSRLGQVEVFSPKGSQAVAVGQTLVARGPASDPEFQIIQGLNRDEWDAWSDGRDQALQRSWAATSQYVPPDVYGTEDLNGNGQWVNTPDYGNVWAPTVGPDWVPYSDGRWAYEPFYGWTWISYDPWGWAPYHYGRWFHRVGIGWCWWPGSFHSRYYWSPALVGFFGFGHGGGFGYGRIGWVPLAPHERFHAWWGHGYLSQNNSTVILHQTNVTNYYRNARVPNAVIAANAEHFGRGTTSFTRVASTDLHSANIVRGSVPVRPTAASYQFTNRATSTTARTNFTQGGFATHMPAAGISRTPTQSGGTTSWNRYSGSTGATAPSVQGARNFGSTPGTRTIPQTTWGQSSGWNRFNGMTRSGPPASAPAPRYSSPSPGYNGGGYRGSTYSSPGSGRSQLQVSPPLVRERGSYNAPSPSPRYQAPRGNYSAPAQSPRYQAPSYSAPRYSPPSYSAPHYSAPAAPSHSAPSGGGGHPSGGYSGGGGRSSGSGGGHSSGGGGGHHR